jgi:CheY-like chemotaxis protein
MKRYQPDPMPAYELSSSIADKFNCILLIDDDCITNYISATLLKKLAIGSSIKIFKNGKEAFDFINSTDIDSDVFPDLIFLDIHMPIMDGYEFVSTFKTFADPLKTKLVILSTSLRTQDEERLKLAGIHFFIDKPLTEDKVIKLLKRMKGV